jgi:hypothetical protein
MSLERARRRIQKGTAANRMFKKLLVFPAKCKYPVMSALVERAFRLRKISPFTRHHVEGGSLVENLPLSQGHQVASLIRMATHLRTIRAPHVPLKLMDRCCLGPADHVERHGLMRVTSEAPHFEIRYPAFNASPSVGEGCAGPRKPSMRLFHASQAEPIGLLAGRAPPPHERTRLQLSS